MDKTQLQARIDAVKWYHEFDFGGGLKARSDTPDVEAHRRVWRFIERNLDPVDFAGKSVLDVGAWDGYWSFYAERRGADSVLATDDCTQNWSQGGGILLAKELLGSKVEVDQGVSAYDLTSLGRKFDVILFLGVYYHLLDPFYALAQIRHCCHRDTVVLVEGVEAATLPPAAALYDFRNHACEWMPTREAFSQMLGATYFKVEAENSEEVGGNGRPGWRWRLLMTGEVMRGSRDGVREMGRNLGPGARRVFMKCLPVDGENGLHAYRPPFGLHSYDPRFRDG